MAEFRWIGDQSAEANPRKIGAFGLTFRVNGFTEVKDEAIAAKLRGNSHFEEKEPEADAPADDSGE